MACFQKHNLHIQGGEAKGAPCPLLDQLSLWFSCDIKALFCTRRGKGKGKEEKGRKGNGESER